ncbi:MAG: hypothetical protein LC772_13365, partial [Chloroflexi bacterium]|nr:hypothetical protein [Chloroflexota bacterium]
EGRQEVVRLLLEAISERFGSVPETLERRILAMTDETAIRRVLRSTLHSNSVEELAREIEG